MNPVVRIVVAAAIAVTLVLDGPILDVMGWAFASPTGPAVTKLMPGTYLFALGALLMLVLETRRRSILQRPWLYLYAAASMLVVVRSLFMSQSSGGELSTAIVSFVTPVLVLICLQEEAPQLQRLGLFVRAFFVFNSLMALIERIVGHRFIPSEIDVFPGELRSAALLGHPLGGAMLTGALLLILILSPRRQPALPLRIAEIALHSLAMFAYGGRTALVFIPALLVASALFARQRAGEARITPMQRAVPIVIMLVGVLFVFLPIPFIEATLQRFTEDDGSANTRNSAFKILNYLDFHQLMSGIDIYQRQAVMAFFNTSQGVELGWVALIVNYGLAVTLPLLVALAGLLFGVASRLDRSAFYVVIFALVVSAGSAGLAGKGLQISVILIMLETLCRRRSSATGQGVRRQRRTRDGGPARRSAPPTGPTGPTGPADWLK